MLLLKASLCDEVYKWKLLNFVETVSYVNLLTFSLANFYLIRNPSNQRVSAYISVGVALLLFILILIYHIHCVLTKRIWYKRLSSELKHGVYAIMKTEVMQ